MGIAESEPIRRKGLRCLGQVHDDRDTIRASSDFTARDRHSLALRAAVIRHPQAGFGKGLRRR